MDETIRQNCYDHIEEERPIGATVTVVSVVTREIPLTATVTLLDGYTTEDVKNQLTVAVTELLLSQTFGETVTVPFSRFPACLLQCPGVADYTTPDRGRWYVGHYAQSGGRGGGRHGHHQLRG